MGLFVLLTPVVGVLVPVASAQHIPVTICHRTGAAGNPFVAITTDNQSIIEAHIGPIAHPPKQGNPDFLLPAGSTADDCKNADPGK